MMIADDTMNLFKDYEAGMKGAIWSLPTSFPEALVLRFKWGAQHEHPPPGREMDAEGNNDLGQELDELMEWFSAE